MRKKISLLLFTALFSFSVFAVDLPDFTDLINATSPAVVKINVRSNGQNSNFNSNVPELYRDFFGFNGETPEQSGPR